MLIHECEQRSDEWWSLRIGIPTSSEFNKLLTSKGEPSKSAENYALTLAGEVYANQGEIDKWGGNEYTARGTALEDKAVEYYEFLNDVQVERVGFITDDEKRMGYSPDGMVNPDGLIEVKCLKAENHIKAILFHKRNGRCPANYVMQPQGGMMITGRAWCDLIFYHPLLPFLVIRQEPDGDLHRALLMQIEHVEEQRDLTVAALRDGMDTTPPPSLGPVTTLSEMNDQPPVF